MNRTVGSWIVGFVCIGGLLVGVETVRAFQKPLRERLPNFDKRHSPAAPTNTVTSAKLAAAARVRGARPDVRQTQSGRGRRRAAAIRQGIDEAGRKKI